MKTDRELLNMLVEAIDYSFWNPMDKEYHKELTYPVIDKVNFIKKTLAQADANDDLEKAAEEYSNSIIEQNKGKQNPDWNTYTDGYEDALNTHLESAFMAGALWQREQHSKPSKHFDEEVKEYNINSQ